MRDTVNAGSKTETEGGRPETDKCQEYERKLKEEDKKQINARSMREN